MMRLAADRDEVDVVADQLGSPTSAFALTEGILRMVTELAFRGRADLYGTFHMTATGTATWADFAERIFKASSQRGGPSARVRKISTEELPSAAIRPANSRLDGTRLARVYGIGLQPWAPAVDEVVAQLVAEGWPTPSC
jgi:dTDP-4-dehydrorhamnose reductase